MYFLHPKALILKLSTKSSVPRPHFCRPQPGFLLRDLVNYLNILKHGNHIIYYRSLFRQLRVNPLARTQQLNPQP